DVRCIDAIQSHREVGTAAPRQRPGCRALLNVDQLDQAVPSEITQLLYVAETGWNFHVRRAFTHADEGDCLIRGTFHEQLHLRVLVGGTECGEWRRADRSAILSLLPQALGPQLHEPGSKVTQRIR